MFTVKLYRGDFRQDIIEAESFTILRYDNEDATPHAEITIHKSDIRSDRVDIYPGTGTDQASPDGFPARYTKAIIENRFGKTTEVIAYSVFPTRRAA